MIQDELPDLDPEMRALLDAEADWPGPPDDAMARVRARVDTTLGGPPPDAPSDPTAPPSATAAVSAAHPAATVAAVAAGASRGLLGTVAAVAFVVGAGAGVVATKLTSPTPAPQIRIEERRVEVPVRVVERVYVTISDAGVPEAAQGTTAPRDAGTPELGASRDRDLADENALVSRAQAALARGRTSEALAALAEHQRRFPRGEFVEEREALAIQALARAGNLEAARARADRFRARFPRSMLMRAVDAAAGAAP